MESKKSGAIAAFSTCPIQLSFLYLHAVLPVTRQYVYSSVASPEVVIITTQLLRDVRFRPGNGSRIIRSCTPARRDDPTAQVEGSPQDFMVLHVSVVEVVLASSGVRFIKLVLTGALVLQIVILGERRAQVVPVEPRALRHLQHLRAGERGLRLPYSLTIGASRRPRTVRLVRGIPVPVPWHEGCSNLPGSSRQSRPFALVKSRGTLVR
ncbi:hypothetical protein VTN49DRAFT_6213 [Thermomyces lanuginosus]|uniref:uncharacterized protein n=1 Tax=Thermomyces lanuginosus TaxID=5541 RepID=UPI0037443DF5